jgi:hypothetical protein
MGKTKERVKKNACDEECAVEREKTTARLGKRHREDDIDVGKDSPRENGCRLDRAWTGHGMHVDDGSRVLSRCGYRTARATRGRWESGTFYYELFLEHLGQTGCVRVGVSNDTNMNLDAPVGADEHSYAFVQRGSDKVHNRHRVQYSDQRAVEGDVIGVLLYLPSARDVSSVDTSRLEFYLNGRGLGRAFENLRACDRDHPYYPCISLFSSPEQLEPVVVQCNFGPRFIAPPPMRTRTSALAPF